VNSVGAFKFQLWFSPTPRVFRLLGPTDGTSGEWTLEVGGEVSSIVLAFSGLTEGTTENAAAQVTVRTAGAN
jgi:hypothetical protein